MTGIPPAPNEADRRSLKCHLAAIDDVATSSQAEECAAGSLGKLGPLEAVESAELALGDCSFRGRCVGFGLSFRHEMIGDRKQDLIGAHRNGLQAAAVGYGFGSHAELMAETPANCHATLSALRAAFS